MVRRINASSLVFAVGCAVIVLGCKDRSGESEGAGESAPPTQTSESADDAGGSIDDAELVARGEYIAGLAGCPQCHTPMREGGGPNLAKAWAGGLEIPEPFGTWRSPNITQHEETGIGTWSDEEVIAAIREGKRPDGEQLFPIMPYMFYNAMSDHDARALVAFMRTIEPIENDVERATDLTLPKAPAPPAEGEPVSEDDPVARGGYLATLMHCAMCHTPPGEGGGPDMERAFQGGFPFEMPMLGEGVLYSTNLTPDEETGIGAFSDQEIIDVVRKMQKRDGSMIQGPMALYQQTWYQIPDEDMEALVAFLRSLPPAENEVPSSTFEPAEPL